MNYWGLQQALGRVVSSLIFGSATSSVLQLSVILDNETVTDSTIKKKKQTQNYTNECVE